VPGSGPYEPTPDSGRHARASTSEPWAELVMRTSSFSLSLANGLREAHHFGHGPGQAEHLCDPDLHARAAAVHSKTLPLEYLERTARSFAECSRLMTQFAAQPPTDPLPPGWATFIEYLDVVAMSLTGDAQHDRQYDHARPDPTVSDAVAAPAVIRYDLLAELMSISVVKELIEISASVRAYAARAMRPSITDEELGWLQRLAHGDRVLDIALDSGLSERTMHRSLQQLWPKLGAHGRADGMITASRLGLLDPPEDTGRPPPTQPDTSRKRTPRS